MFHLLKASPHFSGFGLISDLKDNFFLFFPSEMRTQDKMFKKSCPRIWSLRIKQGQIWNHTTTATVSPLKCAKTECCVSASSLLCCSKTCLSMGASKTLYMLSRLSVQCTTEQMQGQQTQDSSALSTTSQKIIESKIHWRSLLRLIWCERKRRCVCFRDVFAHLTIYICECRYGYLSFYCQCMQPMHVHVYRWRSHRINNL